ncbi:MAG: hypothetical protein M5U26_12890 [Planctomycetota bacterium]|nr:hypothetical protein [Planctomycetota bacterium]
MDVCFDPRLMEEAVFLALREPHRQCEARRYHASRERLYALEDMEKRERSFQELHVHAFGELKLEHPLAALLNEIPVLRRLGRLNVQAVGLHKEEGADLYDGAQGVTALLKLCPETLVAPDKLVRRMRPELEHLADMLDPGFQYDPQYELAGQTSAQENLIRDRFALLWDLRIEARLAVRGHATEPSHFRLRQRFEKLFGRSSAWSETFARIFDGNDLQRRTQGDLFHFAHEPGAWLRNLGLGDGAGFSNSRPCPVCGFPSTVWAPNPERLSHGAQEYLRTRLPQWSPEQGLCEQCEEMLTVVAR